MVFDVHDFIANPSVEVLNSANPCKDDFIYMARHWGINYQKEATKAQFKDLIIEHLQELHEPQAYPLENIDLDTSNPSQLLEIEKLRFQITQAKILSEERLSRAREEERERERQFQREREERQLEREENQRRHELQMMEMKVKSQGNFDFEISKCIKLTPVFAEDNPEGFFREFETIAKHFNWPEEHWVWLIKPKLSGKALKVCENLNDNTDYEEVKCAILAAYSITTEGYRQAFRNMNKSSSQTYVEFASEKLRAFRRWIKSASVNNFDQLCNLVVLEEFKRKVPYSVMIHLTDKEEKDLHEAAKAADVFSLVHRSIPGEKRKANIVKSSVGFKYMENNSSGQYRPNTQISTLYCKFCKKEGHLIKNCPHPKCKVAKEAKDYNFTKPVATTNFTNKLFQEDPFKAFRSRGHVFSNSGGNRYPIDIVRDTACAQSLVLKSALPDIESCLTGEKVWLEFIEGCAPKQLAEIHLDCDMVKGPVTVGVVDKIPIPNASFLMGNDLAGDLIIPELRVTDTPLLYNNTTELEMEQPYLFPGCAVTRSKAKNNGDESLASFKPNLVNHDNQPITKKITDNLISNMMTPEKLIEAQKCDESLIRCHNEACDGTVVKSPSFYYKDNVLMRFYRPPNLSVNDSWSEKHQIVLPQSIRKSVMEIAHEGFGGHLGIRKTCQKILNDFFWPGLKQDVTKHINSCHVCQVAGKPNQTIPPYPLQPIQVPCEPFQKIIIDCVGPLPKTTKGNQYILTVMCPTTRYPEAFPLKNISAKSICKNLVHMFTTFGIPQEVQSDRGSNFTSELFSKVLQELGIKQTLSTAYHPESQGALERWHQTLKSMLRKFCLENQKCWDEGKCNVIKHDIELVPGTLPIRQAPYRLNPEKKQQMREEVNYLLQNGLAVPSSSPWASPCLLVPKEGGQLRMCTDYRRLNVVTIPDSYPLPRVDDLIDAVGQSKYLSKIDLHKGFYQIMLTEKARVTSAFITPFGLYEYLVMPFGMRNSPATFQRVMNFTLQGLDGIHVYLDDILILSETWSQHLESLSCVLQKLQDANLTIRLAKCTFCSATVTYLGHIVGNGKVKPKTANIEAILNYQVPNTRKSLMRFLGMVGFYRRYCPNLAEVAAPLTRLTSQKVSFSWTSECQRAFERLKRFLSSDPVLAAPDFQKPFILHTDASDIATGAVLLQEDDEGVLHPVAYHSAKLSKHQLAYSTIEKELLGIITAIKKFECYLYGGAHPVQIFTDHNPLTFLEKNKYSNQRLLRWSLSLQPYHLQVQHIKGRDNIIADALSRP
ncbi:uncharacterized protein LOC119573219 [Penaeus monodon]|uniref:uncharacterized protein LOC119573219 n=1 Tax=Penaeus monodon TaxID=6687 RepID=UPI0018A795E0|nr:uncharacterized protein LOC119573219 [Penaeus monodon]